MVSSLHNPYPYQLTANGEAYTFTTDSGEQYIFYFTDEAWGYFGDSVLGEHARMFGFFPKTEYHPFDKENSYDPRVSETLSVALRDFFQDRTKIAVFVCDTKSAMQRTRHILFRKWYREFNDGSVVCLPVAAGPYTYASLLYHKENPLQELIQQELPTFVEKIAPYT